MNDGLYEPDYEAHDALPRKLSTDLYEFTANMHERALELEARVEAAGSCLEQSMAMYEALEASANKDRITKLEKLVRAIYTSEWEQGIQAEDVDGRNWFDVRDSVLGGTRG